MKRTTKTRKSAPSKPPASKVFTTVDEFSSFYFPKGRPDKNGTKGKERGAKAAENAFTEISKAAGA